MTKVNCYEEHCNLDGLEVDILVLERDYGWDIYYAKKNYTYTCAFGLSEPKVSLEEAFEIAKANALSYMWNWSDFE